MSSSSGSALKAVIFPTGSTVHRMSPPASVLGGVIASSVSSSVQSTLSLSLSHCLSLDPRRGRDLVDEHVPCLSDSRAAAHAHSSVRVDRCFLPNSTYSRRGGLKGTAIGDDGMLSQIVALGSRCRVGVRGGGMGSSEREATRSNDGRDERFVVGVRCIEDGWEWERPPLVVLFSATLRSV